MVRTSTRLARIAATVAVSAFGFMAYDAVTQVPLIVTGPGIAAGQSVSLEISGLPHHATWPRTLALSLAGIIAAAGIWGAATAGRPRRAA